VAERIRGDAIDLLVDLSGHTDGHRLLVFARKPAPVQVTWNGYANTTGLETMDYRITDSHADPVGATEAWHSERLVRLPEIYMAFEPPSHGPDVGPPPVREREYVTFGSFQRFLPRSRRRW
jgi:predicted O-linked N-acetylglucosamine transferase (SPINDLY family)